MKVRLLLLSSALLGACASVPGPLRGEFTDVQPQSTTGGNEHVRWGGRIVETLPAESETCIEIVGIALDASARPLRDDSEVGRFRACKSGFLDPVIFAPGREVTVTGHLDGEVTRDLGAYKYTMPRVIADELLLWPERPLVDDIRIHHDPFFWGGPWWPVGPVVVYRHGWRRH